MELVLKDFSKKFMNIRDVRVYDMDESLAASGLPKMRNFNGKLCLDKESIDKIKKGRAPLLGGCRNGFGDDNFMKGILVAFNIEYTVFLSPQLQRYGFIDIVSSTSTMHMITKIVLGDQVQEGVSVRTVNYCNRLIDLYNQALIMRGKEGHQTVIATFDEYKELIQIAPDNNQHTVVYHNGYNKVITAEEIYHLIVKNLPQGQLKWMRLTTNYLQLKTIYTQRHTHKLPEWGGFCAWCESLPNFLEFIGVDLKESQPGVNIIK